ncbi:hypothetical protein BCR36DRAFT_216933, partial [Piromyces finnis]
CNKSFELHYKNCRFTENDINSNIDDLCKIYESEKCNDFFKNPVNSLSECKNISSQYLKKYEKLKNDTYIAFLLKCTKNENNEYCPLSNFT